MDHKNRGNRFKRCRDAGRSKPLRKIIIYAEGKETEKSYFDLLKRANCTVKPVTKRGAGISNCVDFVNESYEAWKHSPKEEREKYDERWLVFDADGRADFDKGVQLARKLKFRVAFSNMCIEYWFMLHFYDHDGSGIPLLGGSHSAAQIREINNFIKKYNKENEGTVPPIAEYDHKSKKVEEGFFELMMAIDPISGKRRIVKAFERAKTIHEDKKAKGTETAESVTTIYELLLRLGVIEKTASDFDLYERKPPFAGTATGLP